MKLGNNDKLRSQEVQQLLVKPLGFIVRYGTIFLIILFLTLIGIIYYSPYTRTLCQSVTVYEKKSDIHDSCFFYIKLHNIDEATGFLSSYSKLNLILKDNNKEYNFIVDSLKPYCLNQYFIKLDSMDIYKYLTFKDSICGRLEIEIKKASLLEYIKENK